MYKNADHFSHNNASCTSSSYLSGDTCVILYQLGQITWKTINKEGKKQLAGWIKITLSQNLPGVWLQINLTDCRTRTHTDTHTQHPAVLALLMLCVCVCVCVLGVSLCDLFIPATDCRCICIQTLCVCLQITPLLCLCACEGVVLSSEPLKASLGCRQASMRLKCLNRGRTCFFLLSFSSSELLAEQTHVQ